MKPHRVDLEHAASGSTRTNHTQHTQHALQDELHEAVAIVCSLKHNETKAFRLTNPVGLDVLQGCEQSRRHT